MSNALRTQFLDDGFAVVRGLLSRSEVAFYVARLEALAGGRPRWTQPDGIGYGSIPETLADGLAEARLLAAEPPADLRIEDAWIPSSTYAAVSRRFR